MTQSPSEKTIDTLIQDIGETLVKGTKTPTYEDYANLGVVLANVVKQRLTPSKTPYRPSKTLRMSNVGKPDRQLWMMMNKEPDEDFLKSDLTPDKAFKFMYGSLLEEVLLFLVKASGHTVTDEQREVSVEGILGHMDCRIDGVGFDIKTASDVSFKSKFLRKGILRGDDPFGYLPQLGGYFHGEDKAGFLVANKVDGNLTALVVPKDKLPDTPERIRYIKDMVKSKEVPEKCYDTKDIGKNKALRSGCKECAFRKQCWGDNLRAFVYSDTVEILTEVNSEPRVDEVTLDGKTVLKKAKAEESSEGFRPREPVQV